MIISGRQIRAARAMRQWTQQILARKARVSVSSIRRAEMDIELSIAEAKKIYRALTGGDIIFLATDNQDWEGIIFLMTLKLPCLMIEAGIRTTIRCSAST